MELLKYFVFGLLGMLAIPAQSWAVNLWELEVYPYQTAQPGEKEIENQTTLSDGNRNHFDARFLRSTFELGYGLSEHWELAAYLDFWKGPENPFRYHAVRMHTRTHFAEKGDWPIDIGAYFEFSAPRHGEDNLEAEARIILEKDLGLFTLDLNPLVERPLNGEEEKKFEWGYSAALIYRGSEHWQPRLEFFGSLDSPDEHIFSPMLAWRPSHNLFLRLGPGFGLTPDSEKKLIRFQLEFEIY